MLVIIITELPAKIKCSVTAGIYKIRSFQSLNWQKLTVTEQCIRGFIINTVY